jgi:hypothetical protein
MKASDIMRDAAELLLDQEFVRWPLSELSGWIDRGVETIVTAKPSAKSKTLVLTLASGTKQALPSDQSIVQLLDVVRNIAADNTPGRMVRQTARSELDSNEPNWHNPAKVPYRSEVRQFVFDEILPQTFWVYPGNDGTGKLETIVSFLPDSVVSLHTGDATDIATWDIVVGLDDQYRPALLDYVMWRALSKEDVAATFQKATAFFQSFQTALGVQVQVEESTAAGKRPS